MSTSFTTNEFFYVTIRSTASHYPKCWPHPIEFGRASNIRSNTHGGRSRVGNSCATDVAAHRTTRRRAVDWSVCDYCYRHVANAIVYLSRSVYSEAFSESFARPPIVVETLCVWFFLFVRVKECVVCKSGGFLFGLFYMVVQTLRKMVWVIVSF